MRMHQVNKQRIVAMENTLDPPAWAVLTVGLHLHQKAEAAPGRCWNTGEVRQNRDLLSVTVRVQHIWVYSINPCQNPCTETEKGCDKSLLSVVLHRHFFQSSKKCSYIIRKLPPKSLCVNQSWALALAWEPRGVGDPELLPGVPSWGRNPELALQDPRNPREPSNARKENACKV